MINYYFWEPIWYYDLFAPKLTRKLKKARWLGVVPNCRDALTYYINTENEQGKNHVIVRSVIKTRRKKIGTDKEYINEDSEISDFYIDEEFKESNQDQIDKMGTEESVTEELRNDNIIDDTDKTERMIIYLQRKHLILMIS